MSIHRYVELSTGHISQSTNHWLTDETPVGAHILPYGYLLSIRTLLEATEARDIATPSDLCAALQYAADLCPDAAWLMLDRDAEQVPALPFYDW